MAGYILVVGTYYVVMDTGVKRSVNVFLLLLFFLFFGQILTPACASI